MRGLGEEGDRDGRGRRGVGCGQLGPLHLLHGLPGVEPASGFRV